MVLLPLNGSVELLQQFSELRVFGWYSWRLFCPCYYYCYFLPSFTLHHLLLTFCRLFVEGGDSHYLAWPKLPGLAEWTLTRVSNLGLAGLCLMLRHTQLDILVGFHRVRSQGDSRVSGD